MQSKAPSATEVPLHELLADVLAGDPRQADSQWNISRSCA
jgi:hypothetical protein